MFHHDRASAVELIADPGTDLLPSVDELLGQMRALTDSLVKARTPLVEAQGQVLEYVQKVAPQFKRNVETHRHIQSMAQSHIDDLNRQYAALQNQLDVRMALAANRANLAVADATANAAAKTAGATIALAIFTAALIVATIVGAVLASR